MVGNSLPFESIFFMIFNNCPNALSEYHSLPSIAAIPVWYPTFFAPLQQWDIAISCGPLACARTWLSLYHFHILFVHHGWHHQEHHHPDHLLPLPLLHYLPLLQHHKATVLSNNVGVVQFFFFFTFINYNPAFSMLGPTNIVWYETRL